MKNITLIITGSIAANKGLLLYQQLCEKKINVKLIVTKGATYFLNKIPREAYTELFTKKHYDTNDDCLHIELAQWSDLIVVYPASASFISKMANGICNDLASLVYIANDHARVMVQPAMNNRMYEHPAVQRNLEQLVNDGCIFIEPATGQLACKSNAIGRAQEANDMIKIISELIIKGE